MIVALADTSYFVALVNARDEMHEAATRQSIRRDIRLVTTLWILTELADGFCKPPWRALVKGLIDQLLTDPDVEVVGASEEVFEAAWQLFGRRPDKDWSLTDCTSFVIMQRRGLTDALTGDHHFEQAGFRA